MSLYYFDDDHLWCWLLFLYSLSDFDNIDFYKNWATKICVLLQLLCADLFRSYRFCLLNVTKIFVVKIIAIGHIWCQCYDSKPENRREKNHKKKENFSRPPGWLFFFITQWTRNKILLRFCLLLIVFLFKSFFFYIIIFFLSFRIYIFPK